MLGWPHTSGRFRLTRLVTAAITITWLLASCAGESPGGNPSPTETSPVTTPATTPADPSRTPAWLLTRAALSQITKDNQVKDMLQVSTLYELLQPGQDPLPGIPADPVITFPSATTLEQAITSGQIPAKTYGVLYDPEAWSYTPKAEQQDPVTAATNAAAVAHAHGLKLIVAPALDLTTVLAPGNGSQWQKFLQLDLISQLAKVADIIELQAQSLERDTATYTSFVSAATSLATGARPDVTVLAGLSTNPPGAEVTTQHLLSAIAATRTVVNGYWLNVPGQGPRCPTCNASRPDIAIQTLQQIG